MVGGGNRGNFKRPNGGDRRSGPVKTEDRGDRSRSPQRDRRSQGGDQGKNDRMVFISNLSYQTRWVELKSLVREKGGEMNFIELLEDKDGRPKGSALVEFKDKEAADECIKNLNRFDFQGRSIVAKEIRDPAAFLRKIKEETGIDFLARSGGHSGARGEADNRPQRSGTYDLFGLSPDFLRKHNIEPPLCERIFIANLAYNVGTAKIYEIFGLAGKITWMDLHMDKEGRSKGVCVVQFSHPIEAVQAISMFNGQKLYDRILAVKMDQFEKTEKPREGGLPRGLECLGMGLGAEGAPLRDVASVVSQMSSISANIPVPVPVAPAAISEPYIISNSSGFPSTFPSGGKNAPSLNPGSNGMGAGGYGASSYGAGAPAASAYGAGAPVASAYGAGAPAASSYGAGAPAASAYGAGAPAASAYGAGAPGGFNQQTYGSPSGNIFGRASNCLQIKNLPNDYTWQIVRDRLTQFGEIESLELPTPGVARVRFSRVQDAERTRGALAGTSVEGRSIAVEYV